MSSKLITKKSDQELIEGLDELLYRLWHIFYCDDFLNNRSLPHNEQINTLLISNACIISYIVYVRAINEFFWKQHSKNIIKKDDFLSIDCLKGIN